KNALGRVEETNAIEEQQDLDIQTFINQTKEAINGKPKLGWGEENLGKGLKSVFSGITAGDLLAGYGGISSTLDAEKNIYQNRAGDLPNINAYKNYGKDSLKTLEGSKDYLTTLKNEQLRNLELSKNSLSKRNRNSARGINTLRALDITGEASARDAEASIYANNASQMINNLNQKANMEGRRDEIVMRGEEGKNLADTMDRDNFYTQLGENIRNKGDMFQKIGAVLNNKQRNKLIEKLINSRYKDVEIDTDKGVSLKKIKKTN
ncbi:MAG: hypothetical protein ACRC0V_06690, partial [Fusobacteriaceae bacterium]